MCKTWRRWMTTPSWSVFQSDVQAVLASDSECLRERQSDMARKQPVVPDVSSEQMRKIIEMLKTRQKNDKIIADWPETSDQMRAYWLASAAATRECVRIIRCQLTRIVKGKRNDKAAG